MDNLFLKKMAFTSVFYLIYFKKTIMYRTIGILWIFKNLQYATNWTCIAQDSHNKMPFAIK